MKLKLVLLLLSCTVLVNCGKQGSASDVGAAAANVTPVTEVVDSASDTSDPNANKPTAAASNNFLSTIGNFLGGLFGGKDTDGDGKVIDDVVKCGILPNLLKFGVSYFTGGNVLIGGVVGNVANSLLKCGGDATLLSLIPQGSSNPQKLMDVLANILKLKEGNQDIISAISALKNPKDVSGLINVLNVLVQRTNNDSKLRDVLNMFIMFQASQGNMNNSCGTMNPMACQVFNAINAFRETSKLPALQFSTTCSAAAQSHAVDMSSNNFLSHFSSNGDAVKERLNKLGIGAPWAELIVKGSTLGAQDALNIWLSSEGHRKNLMSNLFTSVGVGYSNGFFTVCFNK